MLSQRQRLVIGITILVGIFVIIITRGEPVVWVTLATIVASTITIGRFVENFLAGRIVSALVEKHITELSRTRAQSLGEEKYGVRNVNEWRSEMHDFLKIVVMPQAPWIFNAKRTRSGQYAITGDEQYLKKRLDYFCNRIVDPLVTVAATRIESELERTYRSQMSGGEYEKFCASVLRRAGWTAALTKASGDQGADIIAEKGNLKVIVQCKNHSKSVGNKAVQEAAAARAHYLARHGVVVSSGEYTRSAKSLAASNHILLLHHIDLGRLEDILDS